MRGLILPEFSEVAVGSWRLVYQSVIRYLVVARGVQGDQGRWGGYLKKSRHCKRISVLTNAVFAS